MHNFANAVKDYRYLKNRAFPDKASLKLVGDRYELTKIQRNMLFRGVVRRSDSIQRLGKLVERDQFRQYPLAIDWYNVLITIESYLKGLPVFLADDGVLRDAAGMHGSYRMGKVTEQAFDVVIRSLGELKAVRFDFFLDSPIAFSGEMATWIRRRTAELGQAEVRVVPSPDYYLKAYEGIVASSDSVIMDNAVHLFDLPRLALEFGFDFRAPDLLSIAPAS